MRTIDKRELISGLSAKLKLLRVEKDYSQEKMAEVIGLSKKTLIDIEKGRSSLSWTASVCVVALFQNSQILRSLLGSEPLEVIETLAHDHMDTPREKTLGGKIWWKDIAVNGRFKIQLNLLSQHYRILDEQDYRWYSTFSLAEAQNYLIILGGENN